MARTREAIEYCGPIPVDLAEIDDALRPASQMRARLDADAIREYAGILSEMPPVKLMWDVEAGKYWVVDGAHTLTAFAGTGQQTVPAVLADGDWHAAFEAASGENARRGVPIRDDDRKARVRNACEALHEVHDFRAKPWTVKRLADFCGVDRRLAGDILDEFLKELGADPGLKREASDGRCFAPGATAHAQLLPSAADGPRQSPRRRSAYEDVRACLDEVLILVASVDAPDDPIQKGWGGFPAVLARMSRWERKSVRNSLGLLIESLQGWQLATGQGARDGPDRGEQA